MDVLLLLIEHMSIISDNIRKANRFERRLALVRYIRNKKPDVNYVLTIDEYEYLSI